MPKQNSSGGKIRLGRISEQGDVYLRRLLVNSLPSGLTRWGAMAVLNSKRAKSDPWIARLLEDHPHMSREAVLGRRHVAKHFQISIADDTFNFAQNRLGIAAGAALDGIYVIRTNLPAHSRMPPPRYAPLPMKQACAIPNDRWRVEACNSARAAIPPPASFPPSLRRRQACVPSPPPVQRLDEAHVAFAALGLGRSLRGAVCSSARNAQIGRLLRSRSSPAVRAVRSAAPCGRAAAPMCSRRRSSGATR